MIFNGIDIVKIDRFKNLITNEKFLELNFNEREINYIKKYNNSLSTMAGIYAGKEAFLKSLKKGINDYSLKDIMITHDDNGAPIINIKGKLKEDYQINSISLSISHDGNYAVASVLTII